MHPNKRCFPPCPAAFLFSNTVRLHPDAICDILTHISPHGGYMTHTTVARIKIFNRSAADRQGRVGSIMATHQHESTELVIHRLSRAIGHLESVKKMVEEGRDCSDVLVQIAAVKAAVNNIGKIILQDHITHCIRYAVETGDKKSTEDLAFAIDKLIK